MGVETKEGIVTLKDEELREIISKYLSSENICVKDVRFKVGSAFYNDDPKVSCEVTVEIPVLTLPL